MRWREVLLLACASSFSDAALADQKPLIGDSLVTGGNDAKTLPRGKKLHGKFLHITGKVDSEHVLSPLAVY